MVHAAWYGNDGPKYQRCASADCNSPGDWPTPEPLPFQEAPWAFDLVAGRDGEGLPVIHAVGDEYYTKRPIGCSGGGCWQTPLVDLRPLTAFDVFNAVYLATAPDGRPQLVVKNGGVGKAGLYYLDLDQGAVSYYHAGGQAVAQRIDDILGETSRVYYLHYDGSGILTEVSDEGQAILGRARYDGLGQVLTSTIPLTLTARLGGGVLVFRCATDACANPTAGLVYLGGGRYYDAALGLPLQPDPFGGAPEAPESLNRYGALGVSTLPTLGSVPGGGSNGSIFLANLSTALAPWAESTASNLLGAGLDYAALGPAVEGLVRRSPWHWLRIQTAGASRRSIRSPLQRLLNEGAGSISIARRFESGTLSRWSGLARLGDDYLHWANRLGRRGVGVEARNIAKGIWGFGPKYLTVGDILPGVGADLFVGALWQLGSDVMSHPELLNDPELLARRAFAGGLSNATTGLIGTGIAGGVALLVSPLVAVSAPVVVVGGLVMTIIIEVSPLGKQIENWWFETFNAQAPWE